MIVFGITGIRKKRNLLLKALLLLVLLLTLTTLLLNLTLPASTTTMEQSVLSGQDTAENSPSQPLRVNYAVDQYWQGMLEEMQLVE